VTAIACEWTAILVWWNSVVAELFTYLLTRVVTLRIALLWILLVVVLMVSADNTGPPRETLLQALLLLAATAVFRLWDDLADIEYDLRLHPQRVLSTCRNLWPFIAVVVAGLAMLAYALHGEFRSLVAYLGLVLMLALLYHGKLGNPVDRPARASLVLVKYPLFVYLLVTPSPRAWLAGLGLYLLLVAYEWRDDPDLRAAPATRLVAAAAAGVFIVSLLYWSAGVRA
jgi:hypothetical protein